MCWDKEILFSPIKFNNITLCNRFIRSASYEGMADRNGVVSTDLAELYLKMAMNMTGTIITGFCFVNQQGRAMQPRQAGISNSRQMDAWQKVVSKVREKQTKVKLFMQISHAGRQTLTGITGMKVVGAGNNKSRYFKQKVFAMREDEIDSVIEDYAKASFRAKQAGFDGVQVHGGHGYLVHQFLSAETNIRKDKWSERSKFLSAVLKAIKEKCGESFPIIVKLSGSDDNGLQVEDTIATANAIESYTDAIEVSYGTMDTALNIFRGGCPVDTAFRVNPLFNKIPKVFRWCWRRMYLDKYLARHIAFTENYNLEMAKKIRAHCNVPIIVVGGIRSIESMIKIVARDKLAAVSMSRPFIAEPDLVRAIYEGRWRNSGCLNCNLCSIYCDSDARLKCYNKCNRLHGN